MRLNPGEIKDVQVPDAVPVDLRAKLIVCLIHLHVYKPLEVNRKSFTIRVMGCITETTNPRVLVLPTQSLVLALMEQSPEEIGDLYLDIGEAYLEVGEYVSALPLLSALVISDKYNLAVVWLRHAGESNNKVIDI